MAVDDSMAWRRYCPGLDTEYIGDRPQFLVGNASTPRMYLPAEHYIQGVARLPAADRTQPQSGRHHHYDRALTPVSTQL